MGQRYENSTDTGDLLEWIHLIFKYLRIRSRIDPAVLA